jgi:hypothetical protein
MSSLGTEKRLHGAAYKHMTSTFDQSKPLTDKHKALVQGYAVHDVKKGDALRELLELSHQTELQLECFQV